MAKKCAKFIKNFETHTKIPYKNIGEYKVNNEMPFTKLSLVEAKIKIEPSIGPIHVVKPKAKAIPTINGKARLSL